MQIRNISKTISILLFISLFNSTHAINPTDSLKKIPDNFKSQCFEYYGKIDKNEIWNSAEKE
jgi:hypothetical protein